MYELLLSKNIFLWKYSQHLVSHMDLNKYCGKILSGSGFNDRSLRESRYKTKLGSDRLYCLYTSVLVINVSVSVTEDQPEENFSSCPQFLLLTCAGNCSYADPL